MNTKLIAGWVVAGVLMLPIVSIYADTDSDRSSPKVYVKDSVITTKIKSKLAKEKFSSLVHIRVDTDKDGAVTLGGTSDSQDAIDKAVSIATAVKGVTSVDNQIKVKTAKN
jgi:hyperosmotically inducible protein